MSIDALPAAPAATDAVDVFDNKAFAFLAALSNFVTQANALSLDVQNNADITAALALGMALPNYGGSSTSSLAIGVGAVSLQTQSGKSWVAGQVVVISNGGNYMKGNVTAYVGTQLDVNVTSAVGSGTFSSWTVGLSYSGLALASSGANNDITSLNALSSIPSVIANGIVRLSVRQTVLSGPVDANGLPNFGGSTGSTTVTASGTLVATAANGFGASGQVDRVGSITNPSWTGLSTNGTMYLYLDIAANGTCTTGSTTLAPTYRWGGADVTTNNQFTFNIQEMVGKVGNSTTASQVYRVFVGEVTVAAGVVSAISWYALMGQYDSGWTNTLPGGSTSVSKNHNLGFNDFIDAFLDLKCLTIDNGYAVGDIVPAVGSYSAAAGSAQIRLTRNSMSFPVSSAGVPWALYPSGGGGWTSLTAASWAYRVRAKRRW